MIRSLIIALAAGLLSLSVSGALAQPAGPLEIIQVDEDNQPLIDDFNAHLGQVRQIFIMGPTCGICLRGMADLNDEYIAARQTDPRLHTFVIYVPALQATFENVAPAAELLRGPRIDHYWQESGMIGMDYQPVFETDAYIWDFWLIYGPDVVWDGDTPPAPDFWQHQLRGAFPRDKFLNRDEFAAEALALVDGLPMPEEPSDQIEMANVSGEVIIPTVAQGYGVPLRQYREAMGGYRVIDAVERRLYTGLLSIGDETFDLEIVHSRANGIERSLGGAQLPSEITSHLDDNFDFDTALIHWHDKGHQFTMDGAVRLDGLLHWNLVQTEDEIPRWSYLVEIHSGTIRRMRAYDDEGDAILTVLYTDFRDVDDVPLAHRVEFQGPDGSTLWVEEYNGIAVSRQME